MEVNDAFIPFAVVGDFAVAADGFLHRYGVP
jgi:hypothetical protein